MDTVTNEHSAAGEPPRHPFQHRLKLWSREHRVLQANSEEALRLLFEGTTATPRGYGIDLSLVAMGADIIERSNKSRAQSLLRDTFSAGHSTPGTRARGVTLNRGLGWPSN